MSDTFRAVLKMPLFTPIGYFPKTEDFRNPSVLPEELRPFLPKSAKIIEDAPAWRESAPADPEPETMSAVSRNMKGKGLKAVFAATEDTATEK